MKMDFTYHNIVRCYNQRRVISIHWSCLVYIKQGLASEECEPKVISGVPRNHTAALQRNYSQEKKQSVHNNTLPITGGCLWFIKTHFRFQISMFTNNSLLWYLFCSIYGLLFFFIRCITFFSFLQMQLQYDTIL